MSRRRRPILILATIGLFTALFAIAANIATSTLTESLPAEWKPRVPLIAWSIVAISALVLIALPVRQYLDEHAPGDLATTQGQRNRRRMLEKVRRIGSP